MNYLAHLFLSCEKEEHIVGNFIADSIRHHELESFDLVIREGIVLHKHIDTFTDSHPLVKQSTKRLHEKHGKYSPIVVDIWYDHLLTRHWDKYTNESLRDFANRMYKILHRYLPMMPKKMQRNLPIMTEEDWLMRYQSVEGMRDTFSRFKHRLSRPELLEGVIENLMELDEELDKDFTAFFPELSSYIHKNHIH